MTEFDKVIHPGGVGKVTASVHTTNFKGEIVKSITVTTNDPTNQHVSLQLKANVTVMGRDAVTGDLGAVRGVLRSGRDARPANTLHARPFILDDRRKECL